MTRMEVTRPATPMPPASKLSKTAHRLHQFLHRVVPQAKSRRLLVLTPPAIHKSRASRKNTSNYSSSIINNTNTNHNHINNINNNNTTTR